MSELSVIKSSGKHEEFSEEKIISGLERSGVSETEREKILSIIKSKVYNLMPALQIRKWIIEELNKLDPKYAVGYEYKSRKVKVVGGAGITYLKDVYETFTKQRITDSLIKETGMPQELAEKIAGKAERFLFHNDIKDISGPLIRAIVNFILLSENHEDYYKKYQKIGIAAYDITELIERAAHDNANQQYNPETVHKLIADRISRNYALAKDIPKHLTDAHLLGQIHIHDLDYFSTRPFCFSHDLRFFLKNGLKADGTGLHTSVAGPAKNATVAILHAAKVLACGQVNCAGGQGFNWFNTILAPYLKGLDYKQMKQFAQMFIYEMSMMYVSRGGQVVFSSIDIEPGVPKTIRDIPAIQPGGKVDEKVTYGDYHDEANKFFNAITDVYMEGDHVGKPFSFPKYELVVGKKDFKEYPDEMRKVSELASKFGTPYYFVQQDYLPEYACYQCCSYLMPLSSQNTDSDLYNGTVRGGGLQVVCLNLPQMAYEAKGDDAKLFGLLRERMEAAKEAQQLKQQIIKRRMKQGLLPFMAQSVDDKGTPYLDVEKQGLEIGMVGLNEMLQYHLGNEMHETDDSWKFGLKTIMEMRKVVDEFKKDTGSIFGVSRVPAESAAYRLARIDSQRYPDQAIVQGDKKKNAIYYTNSTHIRPSADVPLFDRLRKEGSFHPILDGGAMSHVFLGEQAPDPEALTKLTQRIANKTLVSYFAYTKDLTVCNDCLHVVTSVLEQCPKCKSKNIDWYSRITGYYQRVSTWNAGKRQEFIDRKRNNIS